MRAFLAALTFTATAQADFPIPRDLSKFQRNRDCVLAMNRLQDSPVPHEYFLRAIASEPKETVHQRGYADWLREQGEEAYADFVQAQVRISELEGRKDLTPEETLELASARASEKRLLKQNAHRWIPADVVGAAVRVRWANNNQIEAGPARFVFRSGVVKELVYENALHPFLDTAQEANTLRRSAAIRRINDILERFPTVEKVRLPLSRVERAESSYTDSPVNDLHDELRLLGREDGLFRALKSEILALKQQTQQYPTTIVRSEFGVVSNALGMLRTENPTSDTVQVRLSMPNGSRTDFGAHGHITYLLVGVRDREGKLVGKFLLPGSRNQPEWRGEMPRTLVRRMTPDVSYTLTVEQGGHYFESGGER